ncbi:hypothetical protein FIU87_12565 [Bacillus sp. THAF10]|uniref:DUF5107 domain-containing protein n=1 Tax=Bacillus sp. THAF10 TaxID=2587848 RepID=UPI001268877F|nr:DUF5107 domain-containing protein [Bacillus sp. THAF10]QFT89484.1 hypothetical protein FIU87_12565 [Bacillus sp. THAF10]
MRKSTFKGLKCVILENESIQAIFLPDYGGKLASFIDKKRNKEWLFQSKEASLEIPPYGADFSAYDSSGFDDVFPSIDRCLCPESGKEVPDHGEVWALPWEMETKNEILSLKVKSPVFPYILCKDIRLKSNGLHFHYRVINLDNERPFYYIWTPHALLHCSTSTEFLTESHMKTIMSVEHGSEHLGEWGTIHSYPLTTSIKTGDLLDLSKVEAVEAGNCEKYYFLEKAKSGKCGVKDMATGAFLMYEYPPEKIPYLAVWKTQGGYRGDYNIALEPCTGVYDNLYVAHAIKKASSVEPGRESSWWFEMKVGGE